VCVGCGRNRPFADQLVGLGFIITHPDAEHRILLKQFPGDVPQYEACAGVYVELAEQQDRGNVPPGVLRRKHGEGQHQNHHDGAEYQDGFVSYQQTNRRQAGEQGEPRAARDRQ